MPRLLSFLLFGVLLSGWVRGQYNPLDNNPLSVDRATFRIQSSAGWFPEQGGRPHNFIEWDQWYTDSFAITLGFRFGWGAEHPTYYRPLFSERRWYFTSGMYLMTGRRHIHFDVLLGVFGFEDRYRYTRFLRPMAEIGVFYQNKPGGLILRCHASSATGMGFGVGWAVRTW